MRPPIVGVPCLATWCWGPSSLMCCPNSFLRRNSMNFGPTRIDTIRATSAAIRTLVTARSPPQRLCDDLEPDRAGRFHEHGVARAHELARDRDRLGGVGRPGVRLVRACEG